jgi:FkbM family methyltransferase
MATSAKRIMAARSEIVRLVALLPTLGIPLFKLYMLLRFLAGRRTSAQLYFGAEIAVDLWQMMQQRMFYFRVWEPNISCLVEEILHEGEVFVDLGSNVGYFTLLAAKLVGPSGTVISVEAMPSSFAGLMVNVGRNAVTNVRALNCAAADLEGELPIYQGAFRNSGTVTTAAAAGRPFAGCVPALPLDKMLTSEEMGRLSLIKIDIEGGELPVLQRLLTTLDSYSPRMQIICEFDSELGGQPLRAVFEEFLDRGYLAYRIPNTYDYQSWLGWTGPESLTQLTRLPARGCDVLLRR